MKYIIILHRQTNEETKLYFLRTLELFNFNRTTLNTRVKMRSYKAKRFFFLFTQTKSMTLPRMYRHVEYGELVLRKFMNTASAALRWSLDTSDGDACEQTKIKHKPQSFYISCVSKQGKKFKTPHTSITPAAASSSSIICCSIFVCCCSSQTKRNSIHTYRTPSQSQTPPGTIEKKPRRTHGLAFIQIS